VNFSENIPMDAGTSMINRLTVSIFFFPGAPRKTRSSSHVEMLIEPAETIQRKTSMAMSMKFLAGFV
jgi:hypothetical protein